MNLQLHKALSDVMGISGLRIVRAILDGERDTKTLAAMCDRRVKATEETIINALTGNYRTDHLFTLKQALATYDFLHQQMKECDEQIKACMAQFADKNPQEPGGGAPLQPSENKRENRSVSRKKNEPYVDMRAELTRIMGVDLTQIEGISSMTTMVVLSECGPNLSSFPSGGHFSSWLGVCPNHRITGGKIRRNGTRRVVNRLATALRVAAQSLHHSNSALGANLRSMAARHGMPKAITATAHKLARIIYDLMTRGHEYVAQSQAEYEQKHKERRLRYFQKQARIHGYSLVATSTGEVVS